MNDRVKVALVDDHVLLRDGLANVVDGLGCDVLFECSNGEELKGKIDRNNLPDIVLLDINMPVMDGFQTAKWLQDNHPLVRVIALSAHDDELSIIRMLQCGARSYVLKDISKTDLRRTIDDVMAHDFHSNEHLNKVMRKSVQDAYHLSEREEEFLKLTCTEMTYKEIADKMRLSPRTIDGYRDELFKRLDLKSRVGLALFAIRNNLVQPGK